MNGSLYLVELTVGDFGRALRWYAAVLGRPPALVDEAGRFALFDVGAARVSLKEGEARAGTVRLTFEVADLDAELARLAAAGVAPEGPARVSPEGYRLARLTDPDGHRLGLFEWLPRGSSR
jgi:predicted enzyme related to lactoylglutathione lyase